ncbi:MAG TPA: cytochrome C [Promineifilum sp.]|nr:cytochrome C [Promineifilum sp.]
MTNMIEKIVGPRAPRTLAEHERTLFRLPNILLGAAAVLLLASMFLPYWKMTLMAPQYPGGLSVEVYINRMTGDVGEIDGLNHYIGMRPLGEAGQLERAVSMVAVAILVLLVLAAIYVHSPLALLLALPAILWPFIFIGDMYYWMRNFGMNLDPTAPLSSSIQPFVPPILGTGKVGQFETIATFEIGLWMAFLAVGLILAGLYFQRRAYKPLVEDK